MPTKRLVFSGQSASDQARQHVGNSYNWNTNNYSSTQQRADDVLHREGRNKAFLKAAAEGQTVRLQHLAQEPIDIDYADENGYTALHHAVLSGFEDTVVFIFHAGADVNHQSKNHGTPLCLAVLRGRQNLVKLLLQTCRAKVNLRGRWVGSPLHCAACNGSIAIATMLLTAKAKSDNKHAIILDIFDTIRKERNQGQVPDMEEEAEDQVLGSINRPLTHGDGDSNTVWSCSPIFIAIRYADLPMMELLMQRDESGLQYRMET